MGFADLLASARQASATFEEASSDSRVSEATAVDALDEHLGGNDLNQRENADIPSSSGKEESELIGCAADTRQQEEQTGTSTTLVRKLSATSPAASETVTQRAAPQISPARDGRASLETSQSLFDESTTVEIEEQSVVVTVGKEGRPSAASSPERSGVSTNEPLGEDSISKKPVSPLLSARSVLRQPEPGKPRYLASKPLTKLSNALPPAVGCRAVSCVTLAHDQTSSIFQLPLMCLGMDDGRVFFVNYQSQELIAATVALEVGAGSVTALEFLTNHTGARSNRRHHSALKSVLWLVAGFKTGSVRLLDCNPVIDILFAGQQPHNLVWSKTIDRRHVGSVTCIRALLPPPTTTQTWRFVCGDANGCVKVHSVKRGSIIRSVTVESQTIIDASSASGDKNRQPIVEDIAPLLHTLTQQLREITRDSSGEAFRSTSVDLLAISTRERAHIVCISNVVNAAQSVHSIATGEPSCLAWCETPILLKSKVMALAPTLAVCYADKIQLVQTRPASASPSVASPRKRLTATNIGLDIVSIRLCKLEFADRSRWSRIVAACWVASRVLVCLVHSGPHGAPVDRCQIVLHDPLVRKEVLEVSDWSPLRDIVDPTHFTAVNAPWSGVFRPAQLTFTGKQLSTDDDSVVAVTNDQSDTRVLVIGLLLWEERVALIAAERRWLEALELCEQLYLNHELGLGLPLDMDARRSIVGERMLELCLNLIDEVIQFSDSTSLLERDQHEILKRQLEASLGVCVSICSKIGRSDFLCTDIRAALDRVQDSYALKNHGPDYWSGFFLDRLVPHIVCNDLRNVPPATLKELIDHLVAQQAVPAAVLSESRTRKRKLRGLEAVELVILNLDIGSLDFAQVLSVCFSNRLFASLIYLFTHGLKDYVAPLDILCRGLAMHAPSSYEPHPLVTSFLSDEDVTVTQPQRDRTLMEATRYLSDVFKGTDFLIGAISEGEWIAARNSVLEYLFPKGEYDMLAQFILLDSVGIFGVLRIVFAPSRSQDFSHTTCRSHQSIIDHVLAAASMLVRRSSGAAGGNTSMSQQNGVEAEGLTPSVRAARLHAYSFVVEAFANGLISIHGSQLRDVVLCLLSEGTEVDKQSKNQRERALLEVFGKLSPASQSELANADVLLDMAESAKFWKLAELLHTKEKQWDRVLYCHLRDDDMQLKVFDFVQDILVPSAGNISGSFPFPSDPIDETGLKQVLFALAARENIIDMLAMDALKTLRLIGTTHGSYLMAQDIVRARRSRDALQDNRSSSSVVGDDRILLSPMSFHERILSNLGPTTARPNAPVVFDAHKFSYLKALFKLVGDETLFAERPNNKSPYTNTLRDASASQALQVVYLELLCILEAQNQHLDSDRVSSVRLFVEQLFESQTTGPGVALDDVLRLTQTYKIHDASAFLLERTGDVSGALRLLVARVRSRVEDLLEHREHASEFTQKLTFSVSLCVDLCLRNSERVEDAEHQQMWFDVLDAVVGPLRVLKAKARTPGAKSLDDGVLEILTNCMQLVLKSLGGRVSLPVLLDRVLDSRAGEARDAGASDIFGDFKFLILGMLDSSTYEEKILMTATHLLASDTAEAHSTMLHQKRRARRCLLPTCGICGARFALDAQSDRGALVVFFCGHGFHRVCAAQSSSRRLAEKSRAEPSRKLTCPLCLAQG